MRWLFEQLTGSIRMSIDISHSAGIVIGYGCIGLVIAAII